MPTHLTVTAIEWERIHLTIRLRATWQGLGDEDSAIDRIYIRDVTKWHDVEWSAEGDDGYVVRINISTFEDRSFLPSGTWKFFALLSTGEEVGATFDLDAVDALDDYTRVFLFSDNKKAYTVSFGITENELTPLLAMRSYLFSRGGPGAKPSLLRHPIKRLRREAKSLTSEARKRKVVRVIYEAELKADRARRLVQRASGAPFKPRILFASEQRNGLEGNLLAVRDRMVERGLEKDFDFQYSFRTPQTAERKTLISMLKKLAQADIVLLDDYFAPLDWLTLNPDARYIQLWHAGSGFKSIGYSRFGKFGSPALRNAHRHYTYSITGSRHLKHVYAEAFGIEEEAVIPTGLPGSTRSWTPRGRRRPRSGSTGGSRT